MLSLIFPKIFAPKVDETSEPRTDGSADKNLAQESGRQIDGDSSDGESFTSNAQDGVKNVEALTSVWSRSHLIMAYVL
jgi:hypothetical protein